MKKCEVCGKLYEPKRKDQKYCSKQCKDKRRNKPKGLVYIKTCKHCGETFAAKHHNEAYCSDECRKAVKKEYQHCHYMSKHDYYIKKHQEWKDNNREYCRSWNREYKKTHPEVVRAYNKRRYQRNKEEIKARVRQWQKDNRDYCNKRKLEWYHNNKDKVRLYDQHTKARKYRKEHRITQSYCETHNDCLNCPYPFDFCLFELE